MLAFARKAAEMDERIQSKLGIDTLTVKTFHSLAKHIITQVEGVVPAITKWPKTSICGQILMSRSSVY